MFDRAQCSAHIVVTLVTLSVGPHSANNRWMVGPVNEVKSEAFDTPDLCVKDSKNIYVHAALSINTSGTSSTSICMCTCLRTDNM